MTVITRATAVGLVLVALLLPLAACPGVMEYGNITEPHVLPGLGEAACPTGWAGETLDATTLANLETQLSDAVSDIAQAIQSEADRKNTGPLEKVKITRLHLQLESPLSEPPGNQNTLGFLSSLELEIDGLDSDSGLPIERLAQAEVVEPGSTEIVLDTTDVDFLPYLKKGLRIKVTATTRTCLQTDLSIALLYTAKMFF
jgi:hypothetical protein